MALCAQPSSKAHAGQAQSHPNHLLAAVGGQSPIEELHAHDGEGIVEGEQREAKAGEAEGQGSQGGRGRAAAARPVSPALTAGGMPLALAK